MTDNRFRAHAIATHMDIGLHYALMTNRWPTAPVDSPPILTRMPLDPQRCPTKIIIVRGEEVVVVVGDDNGIRLEPQV